MPCDDLVCGDDNTDKKWEAVLCALAVQMDNPLNFNTFLADTHVALSENILLLTVRNGFIASWVKQRMMPAIRRVTQREFGHELEIRLKIASDIEAEPVSDGIMGNHETWSAALMAEQRQTVATANARRFPLRSEMTFGSFIASGSNRIALEAAKSVAVQTARRTSYNPLTITGETGQGKTHLAQAVAHEMRNANLNVVCVTGEAFLSDFVNASQNSKVEALRRLYFALDALILDGIEKLIAKKETQRFFLDLLNHLISEGRQVVVTGNSAHPLGNLSDEITSRLYGGLEVFVAPPDAELKRDLLKRYAEKMNISLKPDAFTFLADRMVRNVRELIGGINRVSAHVNISDLARDSSPISIDRAVAQEAARDRFTAPSPSLVAPKDVLNAVAKVCGVDVRLLTESKRGGRGLSAARDLASYMMREKCGMTSSEVGAILGGRSHSSIIAALHRYSRRRGEELALVHAEQETERLLSGPIR